MRWNELSMSEIADIVKLGVKAGVTDLLSIKETFEYYLWKKALLEHRGWLHDLDEDDTYNYRLYYHDNPEDAWSMLEKDSDTHFTDTYKTVKHPTFSNESMYSGYKNEYNPQGLTGGTWKDDYNYLLSQSQWDNDWDTDATIDYLNRAEEYPVNFTSPEGANILRSLTVYPKKYGRGGHIYDGTTEDTLLMSTSVTPVNYETPWAITNRGNTSLSPEEMLYFNSKLDRDTYAQERNYEPVFLEPMLNEVVATATATTPAAKIAVAEQRYRNNPTPENAYRLNDTRAMADPTNPYNAAKGWIGMNTALAAGVPAVMTAPTWAPWVAKYVIAPELAALSYSWLERSLTGTNLSTLISSYLKNKGVNGLLSDVAGSVVNPGYWINFGGTGRYTRPLFNKVGLGLSEPSAYSALTPELNARLFPRKIFKERVTNAGSTVNLRMVRPTLNFLDRNLYRLLGAANPWFMLTKKGGPKQASAADLPSFKFVKNPEELLAIDYRNLYKKTKGATVDYLLFGNETNNRNLFGLAMNLLKPDFNIKFYGPGTHVVSIADELTQPIFAGISAADMAFVDDEDRNPYIRGLEYYLLGRYGVNALARQRLRSALNASSNYRNSFGKIQSNIAHKVDRFSNKLIDRVPSGYNIIYGRGPSQSNMLVPEDYSTTVTKKGFNYQHAFFDDLLNFLDKHNGLVGLKKGGSYEEHKFTVDASRNIVYDDAGRVIAKRGDDGKIVVVNTQALKNILSKNIDIVDYNTGNKFTGQISVGDDGTVNIPEEYTRILRSNIDYVQNTLFPGSGVKVFGSSAAVTDAGFPHATHDIDFYITQQSLDDLINKGMLSERDKISPGTYTYRLKPELFGEQGNIDLNVLEQTPEGMATGPRAEELYRQYFPDEYFLALRQHEAAIQNKEISYETPLAIGKTPQELLDAVTPSSKTIMDSFDIDIFKPGKSKHTLRAWSHLVYSDPQLVAQGINQYAQSLVGPNARLFPVTVLLLGDRELNLQALKKIGVNLTDSELNRIASDPQRMKNVLDAWYLMDNTAMRYIRSTWPGTIGHSPENFIKSATTWDPINNYGNANGAGLNTTIGGDADHNPYSSELRAFILPRPEYKSTGLLDLIDEINNNFGRNPIASQLLDKVNLMPANQLVAGLLDIYDTLGWNFLLNGRIYGRGMYASATRPFDVTTDAVGFLKIGQDGTVLNPMIPRLMQTEINNPLTNTGYNAIFLADRTFNKPIDFNIEHQSRLYKFLKANYDRQTNYANPFAFKDLVIGTDDLRNAKNNAFLAGLPIGFAGLAHQLGYLANKIDMNAINNLINEPDSVVLGMPEQDRRMFTQEGVDSLYQKYRTDPYWKDQSDYVITGKVLNDLLELYGRYVLLEEE